MAEACRRATLRQLAWTHDWHVREDCYAAALAQLIEAHRSLPLARVGAMGLPPVPMDNFTVRAIAAKRNVSTTLIQPGSEFKLNRYGVGSVDFIG